MNELFKQIEGDEFSAACNIASGMKVFKRCVVEHEAFLRVKTDVAQEKIVLRALELLVRPFDEQHANPNDVAIAAYLLALHRVDCQRVVKLAVMLLGKRLFWARRIAEGE